MPTTERGEKRVGQLTQATAVDPATKIPGEQGTKAVYFTGKQLTDFVSDGVQNQADEIAQEAANKTKSDLQELVQQAQSAASTATTAKNNANTYKNNANTYQQNAKKYMEAIQNFGVSAALVGDADDFGVDKTVNADGSVSLVFNLLKGDPGGQPIPVKLASEMTDQMKLYLYMGSETNYKNGWVYGYTDGAWTALMTYGNGITVDNATSTTSTNPVQNKIITAAVNKKYTKPSTGIPKTDLASAVKTSLGKADTAYQKPSDGIPKTDLASAVKTSLGKADTAYQKPSTGIPETDLADDVKTKLNSTSTSASIQGLTTEFTLSNDDCSAAAVMCGNKALVIVNISALYDSSTITHDFKIYGVLADNPFSDCGWLATPDGAVSIKLKANGSNYSTIRVAGIDANTGNAVGTVFFTASVV